MKNNIPSLLFPKTYIIPNKLFKRRFDNMDDFVKAKVSDAYDEVAATADEIKASVDKGVPWLAGLQNPDGSWGSGYPNVSNPLAKTGLAVLKLETYALENGFQTPFDPNYPYNENVQNGLNFIFNHAQFITISDQTHDHNGTPVSDNPDVIGDNQGIYFNVGNTDNYTAGIALMAVAGSTTPARTVGVGPAAGIDYQKFAQYLVDFLAWGQTDTGFGRGGWTYSYQDNSGPRSDNSVSGWVVTGLVFAESSTFKFNNIIPPFVKYELNIWINYIQNAISGGSGYTNPDEFVNILKTGSLVQQMAFFGDPQSSPRVQNAINYIANNWNQPDGLLGIGWRGDPADYQATFTTTKGLDAYEIKTIGGNINWFDDMSTVIVDQQDPDGGWPVNDWSDDRVLSAAWALLTLEKVSPVIIVTSRGVDFFKLGIVTD